MSGSTCVCVCLSSPKEESFVCLFICLFLNREEGREREGERYIDVRGNHLSVASSMCPDWDQTHNLGLEWELNHIFWCAG